MTGKPEEQSNVGTGRALDEQDATAGVSQERADEIAQDTRPGSAIGGHKADQTPAQERETMADERRGQPDPTNPTQ